MPEVGDRPGGNQPWGEIFQVQTPNLDRVSQEMRQVALQRQQYAQKEGQQLDGLMNKELAKVRSVDMPSVIDAYNKYKNIKQQTLFDKKLQANPYEWNKRQVEANAALGEAQALINKSAEVNDLQKGLVNERKVRYNLYADDFGDRISALNSTPINQLKNHKYGDLTNPDTYRYQGSQTDFGKLESSAAGQPKETFTKEEKINDLQTRRTPVLFGNTPSQFFETIKGNLTQHIPNRDAAAAWEAIPQSQKEEIDKQFNAISPDKWKQWTGSDKPPIIAPTNPNDPAENFAALRAKIYAINSTPREGRFRDETNQQAKINLQFNQKEALEAMRQNNRVALKTLGHVWKQMDQGQQASKLDDLMNGIVDDAKKEGLYEYHRANGTVEKQYQIKLSPFLKKQFAYTDDKGHPIYPDAMRMSQDGATFIPVFLKEGQGNMREVNKSLSTPITAGDFKAVIGKSLMGVKEANKGSNDIGGDATPTPSTSAPKPKITPKKGGADDL